MCGFVVMQDTCKPILGVAVDSQDDYLDHIEELTHKLSLAEKSIALVKVRPIFVVFFVGT